MGDSRWFVEGDVFDSLASVLRDVADQQGRRAGKPVDPALVPKAAELAGLVHAAFWATLRPDEGRYPSFAVIFAPPEDGALRIPDVDLTSQTLARLAPVCSDASRIGVRRNDAGRLVIWGVHPGRSTCVELRSRGPGHLMLSIGSENVAAFRGDHHEILAARDPHDGTVHGVGREHAVAILRASFATTQMPLEGTITALALLMAIEAVRRQGNGGTLLVLPDDAAARNRALAWLDLGSTRITTPVGLQRAYERYAKELDGDGDPLTKAYETKGLREYLAGRPVSSEGAELRDAAEGLGYLSAVDGAVVLTERLQILGFGAVIRPPGDPSLSVPPSIVRKSILRARDAGEVVDFAGSGLGGTRRQSSARFVAANYDTVALTVSHDGPLTLCVWGARDDPSGGPRAVLFTDLEHLLD